MFEGLQQFCGNSQVWVIYREKGLWGFFFPFLSFSPPVFLPPFLPISVCGLAREICEYAREGVIIVNYFFSDISDTHFVTICRKTNKISLFCVYTL